MGLNCLKCGLSLSTRFVPGGSFSTCDRCELVYTSVAHLMQRSDNLLVHDFWSYVLAADFREGPGCPQCHYALSRIPLLHQGKREPVLACKSCYHLVLQESTLRRFESQNSEAKRKALALSMQNALLPDEVERFFNFLADATDSRWVFQLGPESGKRLSLGFTIGSGLAALLAFCALRNAGGSIPWSSVAMACTFLIGRRMALTTRQGTSRSDRKSRSRPREIRDIGSQSKMPVAKSGTGLAERAGRRAG